jgi:RHS repeat-associated protein
MALSSGDYQYRPFGEVIRATGPMAKANLMRFSTKCQDDESDLLYYGIRYVKTSTSSWLNRDPDEEDGGDNIRVEGDHVGVGPGMMRKCSAALLA